MGNCSTNLDEERLVVSPRRAKYMLDCGNTRLYELLATGELESYLDGRSRKILVSSIKAHIGRRLVASSGSKASTTARKSGRRQISDLEPVADKPSEGRK